MNNAISLCQQLELSVKNVLDLNVIEKTYFK